MLSFKAIVITGFKTAHSHRPPIVHRSSGEVLLLTLKATELEHKHLMEEKEHFLRKYSLNYYYPLKGWANARCFWCHPKHKAEIQ